MKNKNKYLGVKMHPMTRKGREYIYYEAWLWIHGKKTYCGSSKDPQVAAKLYDIKAREIYGTCAITNFKE